MINNQYQKQISLKINFIDDITLNEWKTIILVI